MEKDYSELYKQIIEYLPLTSEHREELKKKRGFTDDVINKLQFKSCGEFVKTNEFFNDLPDAFSNALSKTNIVIPYFNANGHVIYIRPHKFGIAGESIPPYCPTALYGDDLSTMVITESEFKAVASCIYGVPAIGIPGISSFSRSKFPGLVTVLSALGVKKVIVCFDNEIKDNPEYQNYKPDITKRFDTQLYAYITAYQLEKSNIEARIATLPEAWMFQGKIDIDSALAKGMPARAYTDCLAKAVTPNTYRGSWKLKGVALSNIERKIDKWFYSGPVEERFNSYWYREGEGYKKISNFVIRVLHTMHGNNGAERACKFISNYGNSKVVNLSPDVMASKASFTKFCYENGDYEFKGTEPQMSNIWSFIFMHQTGKTIIKLTSYGYSEENRIWFFENGAYQGDRFFPVNDDGVVWIEDVGYKLFDNLMKDLKPPKLSNEKPNFTIQDIYDHMREKMGDQHAKMLIAWSLGNFLMPEIMEKWNIYPFVFLYGKMSSGKSTIANWIASFFGFSLSKGIPFANSSVAGLRNVTTQMGMLPVWLEEYRNKDKDITSKNTFLRSIYDKSTIVKATKREDEVKTYKARSTIILSGEEHPQDAALNSRCLQFPVFSKKASNECYKWIEKNKGCFNYFGHDVLTNKGKIWKTVEENIEGYIESFKELKQDLNDRTIFQMSIIAGLCDSFLGESDDFSEWIGNFAAEKDRRNNMEQALNVFWDDVVNMHAIGKLKDVKFYDLKINQDHPFGPMKEVYLWFGPIYTAWEQFYKNMRNDIPASKAALIEHLSSESYFIARKNHRFKWGTNDSMLLNMDHMDFPVVLKSLFEQLETPQYALPVEEHSRYY